jgi:hypothetical protein
MQDQSERLETIMIFGKKSDLKTHLSAKRPTWSHKVVVHNPLEHKMEMDRRDELPPERDPPPGIERVEHNQFRY